jgi:hypothetical protein
MLGTVGKSDNAEENGWGKKMLFGNTKFLPGKIFFGNKRWLPGKMLASVPDCVCMQGLATREVGLGTGEGEGGGILRTQRVSVACLVPVRKGRWLGGEKKETEVGVKMARPSVPIKALTDHRLWARSLWGII